MDDPTHFLDIVRCRRTRDMIFDGLIISDLFTMRLVCSDTRNNVFHQIDGWRKDLSLKFNVTGKRFKNTQYLKFLQRFSTDINVLANHIKYRDELKNIRSIDVKDTDSKKIFTIKKRCSYLFLESIKISRYSVDLKNIHHMKNLKSLYLDVDRLKRIEDLILLKNLKHIMFDGLFNDNIDVLSKIESLKTIVVTSTYRQDINILPPFLTKFKIDFNVSLYTNTIKFNIKAKLPKTLERLSLYFGSYEGELIGLENCENLSTLKIHNKSKILPTLTNNIRELRCDTITSTTLSPLQSYENLISLEVHYLNFNVDRFYNLKHLSIRGRVDVDVNIRSKTIETLELGESFNQSINFVKNFTSLSYLWIKNASFNQELFVLQNLSNLKKLRYMGYDDDLFNHIPLSCTTIICWWPYTREIIPSFARLDPNKQYHITMKDSSHRFDDMIFEKNIKITFTSDYKILFLD